MLVMNSGLRNLPMEKEAGHHRPYLVALYKAGQRIYSEGELSGALYRVVSGMVRLGIILSDGRRQIVSFHLSGEMFGFEAGAKRGLFAEAVGDATISKSSPVEGSLTSEMLTKIVTLELNRRQNHVISLGRRTAWEKIALFLRDLISRQPRGQSLELPMSRADMADYLGLTVETVSRVLGSMKKSGLVRFDTARKIIVMKPEVLALCCD